MSRSHLLLTLFSSTLFSIGCGAGRESDPVPSTLPGSYVYEAKGSMLKKPWAFMGRLELRPDRTYTFALDKTLDGAKDPTEKSVGTYSILGQEVRLRGSDEGDDSSEDLHKLLIKGDSLVAQVGWTAQVVLKGVGAPNVVFVKEPRA